ncbi:MAG: hypothetical protein ACYDCO_27770 [Armatimonadota bacterium]
MLFLVVMSLLLLTAHLLKAGVPLLAAAALLAVGLVWVRRPWAARGLQAVLVLGGLEWLRAIPGYLAEYAAMGKSPTRMLVIMIAVAVFTLLTAFVFQTKGQRKRFGMESVGAEEQA